MTDERTLGNSGLTTPPLILGGNVFGWRADEPTTFAILDAFVAGGGRMIDTADSYSAWVTGNRGGESEALIGAWLARRGRRDDVIVATKVGGEVFGGRGLAPGRIEAAVEGSLERLRTDYVDLYFAHVDDEDTPLDAVLETFDRLVRAGKVRAIGASNYTAPRLSEALEISSRHGWASYSVLQPHYNLVARDLFEGALQDLCVARGIGVVPYFGLASGFLTGKYRSEADLGRGAMGSQVKAYLDERGLAVLAALDTVAAETSATPAQVALAWLAAQPSVVAPIASATTVQQLEEILPAMSLSLSAAQVALLNAASARRAATA